MSSRGSKSDSRSLAHSMTPFELRPRLESLAPEAEALAHFSTTPVDFEPILRQAYSMLPEEHRSRLSFEDAAGAFKSFMDTDLGRSSVSAGLLWFLRSMRDMAPPICGSIYDVLNRNAGILSLTEVPDDVVMWAHYADSHRGILIGFDERHAFFNRRRSENDEFYFLRRVVYADLPPAPSVLALDGNALFVSKAAKWAYEREWRMLAPLRDAKRYVEAAGDTVYLYSIPPDAIVSIVIGARAAATLETSVRETLRTSAGLSNVCVSRALLDLERQRVRVRCVTLVRSEVATTSGAPGNSSGRCNAVFVERTILGYSGYIVGRSERVSKMAFRKARLFRIP